MRTFGWIVLVMALLAAVLALVFGVVFMALGFPEVGVPLVVVGGGAAAIGSMVALAAREGRPR